MPQLSLRRRRDSGTILIIVLWILVILGVLAVSLGRGTHIELSLAKYRIAKVQAAYLARAGVVYAMNQIRKDSADPASSAQDTLYACALSLGNASRPEDILRNQTLGEGRFDVDLLEDEERKINLNALTPQNVSIVTSLMTLLGLEEETAQTIAFSLIDWKDGDRGISREGYGAEDDYYAGLSPAYHCKNLPLDSREELLLVRGMTPEILEKMKDYITIFPKEGTLRINFDTTPEVVLKAAALSLTGAVTNTTDADAQSLVEKLLDYRRGEDKIEATADDRVIELDSIALNAQERVLWAAMSQYRTKKSDYIFVRARGRAGRQNIGSSVEAVIRRDDLSIQQWRVP